MIHSARLLGSFDSKLLQEFQGCHTDVRVQDDSVTTIEDENNRSVVCMDLQNPYVIRRMPVSHVEVLLHVKSLN